LFSDVLRPGGADYLTEARIQLQRTT
jgi:hypothetical protein